MKFSKFILKIVVDPKVLLEHHLIALQQMLQQFTSVIDSRFGAFIEKLAGERD